MRSPTASLGWVKISAIASALVSKSATVMP
jgi:hypothetical protein